ncbi:MAG: DHH family phosphoesterase [Clostridia bacterium]|nr:DHH family phosphoesterase [Clostridia bacterium]
MAAYRDLSLNQLKSYLEEKKQTLILFHRKPDPDCIGSAVALGQVLSELGMQVLLCGEDPIPKRLLFLNEGSKIPAVIWEEMEGKEIPERIISVDVASTSQLGSVWEGLCKAGRSVDLMIDHHGRGERFSDGYVDAGAAATAEILFDVFDLWVKEGKLRSIPLIAAKALYAGLAGDTGGFRFSNTSPQTMVRGAELLRYPIGHDEICRKIFECKTKAQMTAEVEAANAIEYYCGGKFAVSRLSLSRKRELGLTDEDLGTMIDVIRAVEGVRVAMVVREEEGSRYRVSMRSTDTVDVSLICSEFGGGGHARAAGFTAELDDFDIAFEKIKKEIENRLQC